MVQNAVIDDYGTLGAIRKVLPRMAFFCWRPDAVPVRSSSGSEFSSLMEQLSKK